MDDLVEFLRARLDEDEAVAKAASGPEWGDIEPTQPFVVFDVAAYRKRKTMTTVGAVASVQRPDDRAHIARHDPARVLREVEAKRRLLNAHSRPHECIELSGSGERSVVDGKPWELWEPQHTEDNGPCFVVRTLAVPYADHPDYRPEWAPSA